MRTEAPQQSGSGARRRLSSGLQGLPPGCKSSLPKLSRSRRVESPSEGQEWRCRSVPAWRSASACASKVAQGRRCSALQHLEQSPGLTRTPLAGDRGMQSSSAFNSFLALAPCSRVYYRGQRPCLRPLRSIRGRPGVFIRLPLSRCLFRRPRAAWRRREGEEPVIAAIAEQAPWGG